MPGGVLPRRARPARAGEDRPFDPARRPLGMISETWLPTEEPVLLSEERPPAAAEPERFGPSLTVWVIIAVVILVVVLAVVSYRNAPP